MEYSPLWLQWRRLSAPPEFLRAISARVESEQGRTALRELQAGFAALSGAEPALGGEGAPCLTVEELPGDGEGYSLRRNAGGLTLSGSGRGLVYGAFHLLRLLSLAEPLPEGDFAPRYPLRMLDHWDDPDGSVERGYAGNSFFFRDGSPVCDGRTGFYARLLASCGLNGSCINNVNVHGSAKKLLTGEYNPVLRDLGAQLWAYGVGLWIAVSFAAPMDLGGLPTADPRDAGVQLWWRETCARLFAAVPTLKGFLVKADSEGRPGPHSYGRSQAEGANLLAEAVRPFGGTILWRCFVYDCQQDWRDSSRDRAKAQCDTFAPLDGQFAPNVILQVKHGPMDFQIREPVSPLLGRLWHTRSMVEFQLTQEYTGQQQHVCYLAPIFREVLDFRLYHRPQRDTVADTVTAVTAVSNLGDEASWTGHPLAAANLYAFGRICWDPSAQPETLAREWCGLTFGNDKRVTEAVTEILLRSREVYERYTTPLGLGWLVTPHTHYGPSPDGYEYDRWGTYHRATCREIGIERGRGGTDYVSQYHSPLRELYDDPQSCPEELLLFFHRLPYDYRMRDGRTLLQCWYDSHFAGYEEAVELSRRWDSLEGLVPEPVFRAVQRRFAEQLRSAEQWRDVANSWLYRLTLVEDDMGRGVY